MRWWVVRTVLRRELRDVLRDRRTLFAMLVLPVILYPVIMLGFSSLSVSRVQELRTRTFPIAITVDGEAVTRLGDYPDESLVGVLLGVEQFSFTEVEEPGAAVRDGRVFIACDIPADVDQRLRRMEEVRLAPFYRSADEESQAAWRTFRGALSRYRQLHLPLVVDEASGDQATPEEKGGHMFGGLLAMMVIMMAMTGAFYPALDVAAGEKERGTLETLLLSPARRAELVMGKYLTVLCVAVVAALMNLGSMAFTFSGFSKMLAGARGGMDFTITAGAFGIIFAGLLVLASQFSAVCLALSTFARTYKEGQAYLTPAIILVMPLGMIGLLPDMKLDASTAVIPVANMALLMKSLLVGEYPGTEILITLAVCAGCAVAAVSWTAGLFNREEVLFREGKQLFGLRPPPGVPRPTQPPVQAAMLGIVLGLVWMVQSAGYLATAPGWARVVVPQAGLAVLALGLPRLAMVRPVSGLALRAPGRRALVSGALLGVGGVGLSLALGQLQSLILGAPNEEMAADLESLIRGLGSPLMIIACVAVVPAVAEELLFRGLVLQAFRRGLGDRAAVVLSAVLFAVFHLSLHRFFPQAALGVLLALLVLRTGSLWTAVIAHGLHNAILVGWALSGDQEAGDPGGLQVVSAIAVAVILVPAAWAASSPERRDS